MSERDYSCTGTNEQITKLKTSANSSLIQDKRVASNLPIPFESSSVSVNPDTLDVAVAGDDSKVHIYSLDGTSLNPKTEIVHLGPVTDCAYSPDRKYLVACDANRKVILYSVDEYKVSKDISFSFIIISYI